MCSGLATTPITATVSHLKRGREQLGSGRSLRALNLVAVSNGRCTRPFSVGVGPPQDRGPEQHGSGRFFAHSTSLHCPPIVTVSHPKRPSIARSALRDLHGRPRGGGTGATRRQETPRIITLLLLTIIVDNIIIIIIYYYYYYIIATIYLLLSLLPSLDKLPMALPFELAVVRTGWRSFEL